MTEPSAELDALACQVIGAVVEVSYKGHAVGQARVDLLVDRRLVVELEVVEVYAQILSHLRATGLHLISRMGGLLITFNVTSLRRGIKRVIH